MRDKVISFADAAARIPDGATVSVCGAWMQVPDRLLRAVGQRFAETGHPRGITGVWAICPGGVADQPGIEHLAQEGLLRCAIGGSYPNAADSRLRRLIHENRMAAYNLPSGLITHWLREIGAGRPGALSRKGLGTFVDPRQTGGRMNAASERGLLELVEIGGREAMFLPSAPVHVSLIRASTADTAGNLTTERESAAASALVQAAAARASGGLVIAQVRRVVAAGELNPHHVRVPGALVDFVVVDEQQLQASLIGYDPSLSGEQPRALTPAASLTAADRWMARRAAAEVRAGDVVVLGYGISAGIPHLMLEEGRFGDATFGVEHGSWGGLPLTDFGFGNSWNPQAIMDGAAQFDLMNGGCFHCAMLSFLQVDARGRVNVHKLNARPHLSVGIGGFLDIAASAPRLIFVGYFTAGAVVEVEGGELRIVREGKARKFVRDLDNVSFDPAYSQAREILFVTERAVLRFRDGRLAVVEVSPGVDLERDVLTQMEFVPGVECNR